MPGILDRMACGVALALAILLFDRALVQLQFGYIQVILMRSELMYNLVITDS